MINCIWPVRNLVGPKCRTSAMQKILDLVASCVLVSKPITNFSICTWTRWNLPKLYQMPILSELLKLDTPDHQVSEHSAPLIKTLALCRFYSLQYSPMGRSRPSVPPKSRRPRGTWTSQAQPVEPVFI